MIHLIFFILAAAMVVNSAILLKAMKESQTAPAAKDNSKKNRNSKILIAEIICLVMFIIGLVDIVGFVDFKAYDGTVFFMSFMNIALYIVYQIHCRYPNRTLNFAGKLIAVTAVLELTFFNMPSYYLAFGGYKEQKLSFENAELNEYAVYDGERDAVVIEGKNEGILKFEGIDRKIGTVYTDISFEGNTGSVTLKIDTKDETNTGNYRYDIVNRKLPAATEEALYTAVSLSGKVSAASVKFNLSNDSDKIIINGIYINKQIPVDISVGRVFLILFFGILFYSVFSSAVMKREYKDNKRFCTAAAAVITAMFCIGAVYVNNYKRGEQSWGDIMRNTQGNQMSQELVEAFSAGQTNLLIEPSEELLAVENPYDRTLRQPAVGYQNWDHVFYEGKFYSYYGIAPVVLLFWPYHALTKGAADAPEGYFFPDSVAVMIFSIIGMIGLAMLFMSIIRRFFKNLPSGMVILSLILLQTVSGIWFSIGRPDFYEVAMAFGFAFLTWAFYFLLEANIIGKGAISPVKTAVSSLLFALAVMSRPTTAVYCLCAVLFMILGFRRSGLSPKAEITEGDGAVYSVKRRVIYIICAALPMMIFGAIQMWYNYVRFDSPFDFGIQYSLTVNNFTKAEYHTSFVWIAVYNYLFNPPHFSAVYPFVETTFNQMGINGFFYMDRSETWNTSGLFFLALPMFAYLFSHKAYRRLPDRKSKAGSLIYIGLPCVIMPLLIIASVWESGYAVRYMVDFSWQMLIGAFAVFFFLYLKTENKTIRKLMTYFMCFSVAWGLFVEGIQFIRQAFTWYPDMAYEVEQMFAFWL